MNIKITKQDHERLCKLNFKGFAFGSRLFGTQREDSDYDFIRMYSYNEAFGVPYYGLPNIHSFQVDLPEISTQYIWMTVEQFYGGLCSGDGTMQADIVMFGEAFRGNSLRLEMCRTYKIIRAYCGVCERDLKLHKTQNKLFHANRSLYIAMELFNNRLPTVEKIQEIALNLQEKEVVLQKIKELRNEVNLAYDRKELQNYYIPITNDSLLNVMLQSNNTKEFKYE